MAEKTTEQLEKELAALQKENKSLKEADAAKAKELKEAAAVVADLKEQLAAKSAGVLTVKVGKVTYKVVGGGFHKGTPYTKNEIAADPKIAKELVEKGSGLLIKIK